MILEKSALVTLCDAEETCTPKKNLFACMNKFVNTSLICQDKVEQSFCLLKTAPLSIDRYFVDSKVQYLLLCIIKNNYQILVNECRK